ncbi:MAG TPA: radical SAM protein, partial [Candidatus Hydrogenedentes bacterium]|nr:radical SAM protein [Candidatus Hydrogenedentota bacterium]
NPHPDLSFARMLDGLIAFREQYHGAYWLEVFLVAGYTAIEAEVRKIADCVRRIRPDRVQLNTVTRPPTEPYALPATQDRLKELAARFDPPAEIIADERGVHAEGGFRATRDSVLAMILRRPCSLEDIAAGLGLHRNEAVKYIQELAAEGLLEKQYSGGKLFYRGKHTSKEIERGKDIP